MQYRWLLLSTSFMIIYGMETYRPKSGTAVLQSMIDTALCSEKRDAIERALFKIADIYDGTLYMQEKIKEIFAHAMQTLHVHTKKRFLKKIKEIESKCPAVYAVLVEKIKEYREDIIVIKI